MARSLILDAGAVIALARGDRRMRSLVTVAREEAGMVVVPAIVVTQTVRGMDRDAAVNRVLKTVWVPFVGLRLARVAGALLASAGTNDAADGQVVAEAIRNAPCLLATSDPIDMTRLLGDRRDVFVVPV